MYNYAICFTEFLWGLGEFIEGRGGPGCSKHSMSFSAVDIITMISDDNDSLNPYTIIATVPIIV